MTDEEKAHKSCYDQIIKKDGKKLVLLSELKLAYLNGLAEGKPKWHDLRKNPDDLPERMEINSKEVYVAYSDNNCTDFASYNFSTGNWERSEDDSIASIIIAWCEIPKFEE